ncbi:MAG: hypothetical protein GPOALKHO_000659 [Sodalis sp.]|nr:MAG: hypothetical protein GPOALKHO_000659 [Sodalis sp.]
MAQRRTGKARPRSLLDSPPEKMACVPAADCLPTTSPLSDRSVIPISSPPILAGLAPLSNVAIN